MPSGQTEAESEASWMAESLTDIESNLKDNKNRSLSPGKNWKEELSPKNATKDWEEYGEIISLLISRSQDNETPIKFVSKYKDISLATISSGWRGEVKVAHHFHSIEGRLLTLTGLHNQATVTEPILTRLLNKSIQSRVKVPSSQDILEAISENQNLTSINDVSNKSDFMSIVNSTLLTPQQLSLLMKVGLHEKSLQEVAEGLFREMVSRAQLEHEDWKEKQIEKQMNGSPSDNEEPEYYSTEDDFFPNKNIKNLRPLIITFQQWAQQDKKEDGLKPTNDSQAASYQDRMNRTTSLREKHSIQDPNPSLKSSQEETQGRGGNLLGDNQSHDQRKLPESRSGGKQDANQAQKQGSHIKFTGGPAINSEQTSSHTAQGSMTQNLDTSSPKANRSRLLSTGLTPMINRMGVSFGQTGGPKDMEIEEETTQEQDKQFSSFEQFVVNQSKQTSILCHTLGAIAENLQNKAASSSNKISRVTYSVILNAMTTNGEDAATEITPFAHDMLTSKAQEGWLDITKIFVGGGAESSPNSELTTCLQKGDFLSAGQGITGYSTLNIGPLNNKAMANIKEKSRIMSLAEDLNNQLSENERKSLFDTAYLAARTVEQLITKCEAMSALSDNYFGGNAVISLEHRVVMEWVKSTQRVLKGHQINTDALFIPKLEYLLSTKTTAFLNAAAFGVPSVTLIDSTNVRQMAQDGMLNIALPPVLKSQFETKKKRELEGNNDNNDNNNRDNDNNQGNKRRSIINRDKDAELELTNELYKLTVSKYMRETDNKPPMFNKDCEECMGYHCKGFCFSDCARAASHNKPKNKNRKERLVKFVKEAKKWANLQ